MMKQWGCKWRNKRWIAAIAAIVIVYFLVGRSWGIKRRIGDDLRVDLFLGDITYYFDNHDHVWHNDGATVLVMNFFGQAAKQFGQRLRLPGSYALALYDQDTDILYYFQRSL